MIKVIKTLGYENFKTIDLPESKFWDERTQRAVRVLPEPKSLHNEKDAKGVHNNDKDAKIAKKRTNRFNMNKNAKFEATPLKSVTLRASGP